MLSHVMAGLDPAIQEPHQTELKLALDGRLSMRSIAPR